MRKTATDSVYSRNWNSYQITQLVQVVHPTDSVQTLSESFLALSKHLINKIDFIFGPLYSSQPNSILSTTPDADPRTLQAL